MNYIKNKHFFLNVLEFIKLTFLFACLACLVVAILSFYHKDFFFIDDAQNDLLPFMKEMGRIWLSGHIPILTTNTFLGGNILVDMANEPFAPQTIITSIIAAKTQSLIVSVIFFAWLNTTLLSCGGYYIGRKLAISRLCSLLLGFSTATIPMVIFLYDASWYNETVGLIWLILGCASLISFALNSRLNDFLLSILFLCFLASSSATHMQIAYIVFYLIIILVNFSEYKSYRRVFNYLMIGVCATLIAAIPLMSEFIIEHSLVERVSRFDNSGNFLVTNFNQILNFFNPFYHTYFTWFLGGYIYYPVSLGYATMLAVVPIFFIKIKKFESIEDRIIIKILFISLLTVFVLLFLPSQFGPLRWPFRFLPVFSFLIICITMFYIDRGEIVLTRSRQKYYIIFGVVTVLLQIFSAKDKIFDIKNIYFGVFYLLLLFLIFAFVTKYQDNKNKLCKMLFFVAIFAWFGNIFSSQPLNNYWQYTELFDHLTGVNSINNGYQLNLEFFNGKETDVSDLHSAHGLLYGLKSINGYSPVGHKGIDQFFIRYPGDSIGIYQAQPTLLKISQPAINLKRVFNYQLFNIGVINAWQNDITPEIYKSLTNAGLEVKEYTPYGNYKRVIITPKNPIHVEGDLTYQSDTDKVKLIRNDGMTTEYFNVTKSDKEQTLIFSRVFWHGYKAYLNGSELPVSSYENALVELHIPANMSGELKLEYIPVSWKYSKWFIIIGLILMILEILYLRRFNGKNK